jgi:hypothetical protein
LLLDGVFISLVLLLSIIVSILLPKMFPFVGITLVILIIIVMLNRRIKSRLRKQIAPFYSRSMIRNVDYLIIGDICDPSTFLPEKSTYIYIGRPNRGFVVSYQILRHTHSILKDKGGEVVFVIKSNCLKSEEFSVFDIPFLHNTTIKELGLEKIVRRNRWPLIFEPIISVKFIMNRNCSIFKCIDCPDEEIITFCRDRNFTFRLILVQ